MKFIFILALFVSAHQASARSFDVTRFTLDNGLRVTLRPVENAQKTALVTLFDIGEANNPAGRSGLAHLIEHLYITCATGEIPIRTAGEWFAQYPDGVNAQTGMAYTVIATVFPDDTLEAEIIEAASRMKTLDIDSDDLLRELPRMEEELGNMFERFPHLVATNLGRQLIEPRPQGARRGGVMEQLRAVSVEEARDWHRRYYKPGNAHVVIVGRFEPERIRELLTKQYGPIPAGEDPPAPVRLGPSKPGVVHETECPTPEFGQWPRGLATIAFRVPAPGSDLFAPSLMFLMRMQIQAMPEMQEILVRQRQGWIGLAPVQFAPLDDPRIMFLGATIDKDPVEHIVFEEIRQRIRNATNTSMTMPMVRQSFLNFYGAMFGLVELPDTLVSVNPYFAAFSMGRLEQLDIDPVTLRQALDHVTEDDIKRCAEAVFGERQGAGVLIRIK